MDVVIKTQSTIVIVMIVLKCILLVRCVMKKRDEDKLYSKLYAGSRYGCTERKQFQSVLNFMTLTDKSIVDVGCGNAWLRNKVKHDGYIGIDIASIFKDRAKVWASNERFLHLDLRYPQAEEIPQSDIAICMDLLEHIDESAIDQVIKNTLKLGKETVFGIALFPHVVDGDVLHVTLKSADWWRKKVEEHTKIAYEVKLNQYVLFFITERDLSVTMKIPYSIGNIRIKRNELDGSFSIARRHREAEEYLDGIGIRVPNCLQWFLPYDGPRFDFTETVYIVGKGPSLDQLRKEHFDGVSTIICINDSIHKIVSLGLDNPLYMCQQDAPLKDKNIVEGVTSILAPRVRSAVGVRENVHYVHPRTVGPTANTITGVFAMNIAQQMGVRSFKFMCFDACVNKKLGYAKCIDTDPKAGGRPNRFLEHRRRIDDAQGDSEIEWIIPIVQALKVSDTLQQ